MSRTDYKIQEALDDFAFELGLRRTEDGHLSGVIDNDKLPKKSIGLLSNRDQEPVPTYQFIQLQKQVLQLASDLQVICKHFNIHLSHNQTVVDTLGNNSQLKSATVAAGAKDNAQTPQEAVGSRN